MPEEEGQACNPFTGRLGAISGPRELNLGQLVVLVAPKGLIQNRSLQKLGQARCQAMIHRRDSRTIGTTARRLVFFAISRNGGLPLSSEASSR